ncbi:MAG: type VI secretion system ATPase TssH, partial [Lentisphaerae bacterium]|nr:type VI secretion system ATPase TssH [Lentisphaerota bacterium]
GVNELLRAQFRPEFLNRVDEIVLFHSLRREEIRRIVDIQVARVAGFLEKKRITLRLTDGAKDLLARDGYDPAFGARPLKRAVQRRVSDALASQILSGAVPEGASVVGDVESEVPDNIVFRLVPA